MTDPTNLPAVPEPRDGLDDALENLRDVAASLRTYNARLLDATRTAVLRARLNGETWAGIARDLGLSRQAVHARWRHLDSDAELGHVLLQVRDDGAAGFYSTALQEYLDPAGAGHRRALARLRSIPAA